MSNRYVVDELEHGVSITGPVPIPVLCALAEVYRERGLDLADTAIASKIGASIVFVSRDGGDRWRQELGIGR